MGNKCSRLQKANTASNEDGHSGKQGQCQSRQNSPSNNEQRKPKTELPMTMSTSHISPRTVLGKPMSNVRSIYTLGRELGRGQFGITYLCTNTRTGEVLACKSITKRKLKSKADSEDVKREVQIMHHLSGTPNIVELKGVFEDKQAVHIVMELCAGGELFDRIIAKGHYSEQAAASICRTIALIVHRCHSLNVFHRDLKPENFLLANKEEGSPLKATDFGLSVFFKPGEVFHDVVGSAYYVAPEILRRKYGPEADVWSVGVILYILLCGVPPFWAETEQGIYNAVLRGHINFESEPWPKISTAAKDLLSKMLKRDPKDRLTAEQVLSHPWMKEDGETPDLPLDNAVLIRLKNFSAANRLKKLALKVIAQNLSEDEIIGLERMFKAMDVDNSGTITFEELREGLRKQGSTMVESDVKKLMEAADVDGNGKIDFNEFISATIHMNKMEKEDNLFAAFQHFDKDNSGYITIEELQEALQSNGMGDAETINEIVKEVDTNKDGRIDYDEFVAMMKKGNDDSQSTILSRHR